MAIKKKVTKKRGSSKRIQSKVRPAKTLVKEQKKSKTLGRPTEYRKDFDEVARKMCLLGATDVQLADMFGVNEKTINTWKNKHPSFLQALRNGKDVADAEVAESLHHRATGYSHPEDKIFLFEGSPVIVPTIKHYPPDTAACIIWLKNRKSEYWRDKHELEPGEEMAKFFAQIAGKRDVEPPGAG